jgi:hypothetical protein
MAERYFEKFPNIVYANTIAVDLTRRVKIIENEKTSPYIFYPYELQHQLRSDLLSEYYYEDSEMDWFIYLSNQIIDPYYEWYLGDLELEKLLIDKYGSVETSLRKVVFYRNNWYNDENEISVPFYNNNLNNTYRKYYSPVYGIKQNIVSYKRKEDNTLTNTNRILQYTISTNNASNAFTVGELVDIKATGTDATIGTGEVETSNTLMLRVKNVSDNTSANVTHMKDIVGETSGANVTANAVVTYFENITTDEGVFWDAVTYYDWEVERNEDKKNMKLIGDTLAPIVVNEFTSKLRQDVNEETGLVE